MKTIKIGSWILIKATDFPHFQKAHRLARELTEQRIDDILNHHYHLCRSPGPRKKVIISEAETPAPYPGEEGVYPAKGE